MKGRIGGKYTKSIRHVKTVRLTAVLFALFIVVALSGCVEDVENEQNNTTEIEYTYNMANVESIDILIMESFPVQINVIAEGYLPDGCTKIDEIRTEREGENFNINITTKRPKDAICTQAIESFRETIPLEVQGLRAGNYTVNVNGVSGSFELTVDNILKETPDSIPPGQQVITETDNGTGITLENEETFYLSLKENPTTGYKWELNLSQGLDLVSEDYHPPESDETEQPIVGAGGIHVWEIKADSEGAQQVTAVYKRPWENKTGTEGRFILNVDVV